MKPLLLTALLLSSLAAAQDTTVPVPQTTPAAAPTSPASTAAPVTPAATPATAPTLTLSAAVGASTALTNTVTVSTRMTDVQVTAAPGAKVTQTKLDQIRRDLTASAAQFGQNITVTGKAFFKVASRDAGGVKLVSTMVQNAPGQKPITMRIAQTVAPDGQISDLTLTSDNPVLSAMFSTFTPEKLQDMADQNGANFTGVYGQPLVPGEPRQATVSVDMQDLLRSLLGTVATPANAGQLLAQVQAGPLTVTTDTTYQGLNAQGQHVFGQVSRYGPWKVSLPGKGDLPAITVTLVKVEASGTQAYRRDGLPVGSSQRVKQQLRLTMLQDGVQVAFTMLLDQTAVMKGQ